MGDVEYHLGPGNGPFENFLAAVRSRKVSDLNADVLVAHYSSACCHLANMSIRLGGKTPFRPRAPYFDTDADEAEVLERTEQYLAANGMKIEESGYTLGRKLFGAPMKYALFRFGHFPERWLKRHLYLDFTGATPPRYSVPETVPVPEHPQYAELRVLS